MVINALLQLGDIPPGCELAEEVTCDACLYFAQRKCYRPPHQRESIGLESEKVENVENVARTECPSCGSRSFIVNKCIYCKQ